MKEKEAKKLVMQGMTTLIEKMCEIHKQVHVLTDKIEALELRLEAIEEPIETLDTFHETLTRIEKKVEKVHIEMFLNKNSQKSAELKKEFAWHNILRSKDQLKTIEYRKVGNKYQFEVFGYSIKGNKTGSMAYQPFLKYLYNEGFIDEINFVGAKDSKNKTSNKPVKSVKKQSKTK